MQQCSDTDLIKKNICFKNINKKNEKNVTCSNYQIKIGWY